MEKNRLLQMKETSSSILKNEDNFQLDSNVPTNQANDICLKMASDNK